MTETSLRGGIEVVGVGVEVAVEAIASALLGLELVEEPIAFKVVVLNGIDEFFARSYAVLEEQVNDLVGGVALGMVMEMMVASGTFFVECATELIEVHAR